MTVGGRTSVALLDETALRMRVRLEVVFFLGDQGQSVVSVHEEV